MLVSVFFIGACAHAVPVSAPEEAQVPPPPPIDPAEMHIWTPPSEEELAARHRRQQVLDAMSSDLEKLFMGYAHTLGEEIILENLVSFQSPQYHQWNEGFTENLESIDAIHQSNVDELQKSGEAVSLLEEQLEAIRKQREARRFRLDEYQMAIRLFRDARYAESITVFNRVLATEFPPNLHDNILFGLGSNYYRLRQYEKAKSYFDPIVEKHPSTDKWLVAHAMLGMIYNLEGQKSRALWILQKALDEKPTGELLSILQNLVLITQGKKPDVAS
ncbi:tetratricopeptide repeat protein [Nitrospina sp. 32_T5]|uniref:tetratricopeptide repeat protein n=1 Tax=unclassified Nitrospina TaxID=2638683 RepID=UPI003F993BC8